MKTTHETTAGTDTCAPPSGSAECKRLSFNPKDMSLSFGYRAAIKAVESSMNRDTLINSEISDTPNDTMTQNKLTVKAHMNKHWHVPRRDAGAETNRSKSAQVKKERPPPSKLAPLLHANISKTINSEVSLTELQNKTTQDKSKDLDARIIQPSHKPAQQKLNDHPEKEFILKRPTNNKRNTGFIRSLETSQIAQQLKTKQDTPQSNKRRTLKFNTSSSRTEEDTSRVLDKKILINFLSKNIEEDEESTEKVEETSFYKNFPIPPPSCILREPKFSFESRTGQFLDEYRERFDHFVYEFFLRDDGLYKCLQTGQTYHSPVQQLAMEDAREKLRKELLQKVGVVYDTREDGSDFSYLEYLRWQKQPKKNRFVDFANEQYQKIVPYILNCHEAIDSYGEHLSYVLDLRTNMPRYKNNLLPSELKIIEQFYQKIASNHPIKEKELLLMDDIVGDLGFFRKIEKEERLKLLEGAVLRKYEPEDFVVRQGDHGNSMFIILFGSANVVINGIHPKTKQPHKFIVASLLDGSSFGEYSLLSFPSIQNTHSSINQEINELKATLNPKGLKKILEVQKKEKQVRTDHDPVDLERLGRYKMKLSFEERQRKNFKEVVNALKPPFVPNTRAASIQIIESSYMLEVSAELFKSAIVDKIREEMVEKIRLLSLQPYFSNHSNVNFIPIAMLMKRVDFKHGQTLIKKGDTPTSLLIIRSGSCEVVSIMSRSRDVNTSILKHSIQRPLTNFTFARPGSHSVDIREKYKEQERQKKLQELEEEDRKVKMPSTRLYVFDPVVGEKTKSGFRKYYDFFLVKRLTTSDSLFTRSLLSKNISGDGNILREADQGIEKAKLSVLASSARVECYELKMNQIVFIPQPTKSILLEELKKLVDHDIDIDHQGLRDIEAWDDFKEHEYISQLLRKQTNRKDDLFKKF